MAKIKNPVSFTEYFGLKPESLVSIGVFNPTLNVDTKLFIDPYLLDKSEHGIIKKNAFKNFKNYFEKIIKLLQASQSHNDVAWRAAADLMKFHEIPATCLGYGGATIHGSAWGTKLISRVLNTAKEIVNLGIEDPELFILLPLLEENMGADRISDMTTNVILPDLAAFTEKVLSTFPIPKCSFEIGERQFELPSNPFESIDTPVILVPLDILRNLPVASDWEDVADAALKNIELRRRVNRLIGAIWTARTRKDKADLRARALSSSEAFQSLLDTIKTIEAESYDFNSDPEGVVKWREIRETIAKENPRTYYLKGPITIDSVFGVVRKLVDQFEFLIEKKGLSELLWHKGKPHKERFSQRLFYAVADSYCKANNLDITPEADTGVGPVDFKFSSGYKARVLVEVKLSTNSKLIAGYDKQLEAYKDAEESTRAIYLVVDVGKMGKKDERLIALKNKRSGEGKPVSEIVFVDGKRKPTASKR